MRRSFFVILLLLAAGGAYYLYKYTDAFQKIGGAVGDALNYKPAETPKQAAEFFIAALKERDYDKAAAYCTTKYADQLKAASASAKKLGGAIDGLMDKMSLYKITNTPDARTMLWLIDPFPKEGLVILVNENNDPASKTASAQFKLTATNLAGDRTPDNPPVGYRPLPDYYQSLYKGIAPRGTVSMVKDKQGDKVAWKFDFDAPATLASSVKTLNGNGLQLASEIKDFSMSLNNDAARKEAFDREFKEMINKWAQ